MADALHQAVARAIADADGVHHSSEACEACDRRAAVAVGVVLAEATRSIKAAQAAKIVEYEAATSGGEQTPAGRALWHQAMGMGEALIVLAALADEA